MKKLAVIGASYLQLPLVKKAKDMGLEVHCFAWADGAVCKNEADYFYPISIIEKDKILSVCQQVKIDGICTIASDVAAPTVAYVAEKMGLIGNSYECSLKANNKYMMRNALTAAGIPCPKYRMVKSVEEVNKIDFNYPLIVKPTDRSGSLGVTKISSKEEMNEAVEKALSVSFKKEAIIEEFIEGREISVEFISYKGIHYPLQITDKITTGAPHFVELEHHQPADFTPAEFEKIYALTNKALNALGVTNGASHSEYKITKDGRTIVMEIGARMGGDFIGSDLVRLSTGYDYLKGVIDVALGLFEMPKLLKLYDCGVRFICEQTKEMLPYISDITAFPQKHTEVVRMVINDSVLIKAACSADRSGYIIYKQLKNDILPDITNGI